jgi:hypothetical protein
MREKVHPDRSSVSEVHIYRNNENVIVIVSVRPNICNNFLSRELYALDPVNENGCLTDPNYFESELPFLYDDIENLPKPSE